MALVVVGSLIRLLAPWWVWATLAVAWFAVMAVRELGLVSFAMPQNARLVPESVFRHGRFWGPFEFGLEMGTGVRTYVTSSLPYVAILLVAVFATPLGALLAGIGFGLGRTLMTIANLRYGRDGQWDVDFDRHQRPITLALLASFALSLVLIVQAAAA